MDSFYDAPRRPPLPPASERLISRPVVPDISVLCPSNGAAVSNKYTSYGQWRMNQNPRGFCISNKENRSQSPQNMSYLKKQVRFESPVLQQRPSLTYEPILPKSAPVLIENAQNNSNSCDSKPGFFNKSNSNKHPLSFEQIYMANIPNRHLDLSVVDLPQHKKEELPKPEVNKESVTEPKEKSSDLPQTYKDFRKLYDELKIVDPVIDILNYKRPEMAQKDECSVGNEPTSSQSSSRSSPQGLNLEKNFPNAPKIVPTNQQFVDWNHDFYTKSIMPEAKKKCACDCMTQTSKIVPHNANNTDDPTVKDLLKIISQQNEQLLLLQKQVATLISRDQSTAPKKQIESGVQTSEKYLTSTQHEQSKPRGALPKFSIDLMTSFEVSFKRQTNMYQNKELQIQEVTETETCSSRNIDKSEANRTVVDTSLFLQEPLDVRESCPSPEPSIKINMNDYEDSDDENESHLSASEISSTFYENLMDQVNKILRKAQIQTNEDVLNNCQNNTGTVQKQYTNERFIKDKTMNKVKEATLKNLQSIGVNVENFNDSSDSLSSLEDNKNYNAKEISFAVKQLLLKYLPDDHLAKIRQTAPKQHNGVQKIIRKDKASGIIPNRPEFSFASVQYMKKYNLIASSKEPREVNKVLRQQTNASPKILDISKLKQQPKLL